jgi:hypothetical protein
MNRNALILLGCSGSLAFTAIAGNAANAIMPPDYAGATGSKLDSQTVSNPMSPETAPVSAKATEAQIKQLSQATFGCTCAVCMGKTRQMLQQGQLSL